jgi:hypothetical protein
MNRDEFLKLLDQHKIDRNLVSFDSFVAEGHCLRKNHFRWETLLRERDTEYNVIGFPSESNALEYLLSELIKYYGS